MDLTHRNACRHAIVPNLIRAVCSRSVDISAQDGRPSIRRRLLHIDAAEADYQWMQRTAQSISPSCGLRVMQKGTIVNNKVESNAPFGIEHASEPGVALVTDRA